MSLPLLNTRFKTTLSAKISDTATSLTLDTSTDAESVTFADTYLLTIDEGTSKEEDMVVTLTGASGAIGTRGLSKVDMKTLVTGNRFEHDRGAIVKITNAILPRIVRLLNGTETFDNKLAYTSVPTLSADEDIATKKYADDLAIAGAADSTESVKGIVEAATSAEVAAGDDAGSTTAPTVVRPSKLAEVIQKGSYLFFTEDGTGADDTYTATLTPTLTAYTEGQMFVGKITVANTTAATLNIDGLGAKAIKKYITGSKVDIETGDIIANQHCVFVYDGTDMIVINPSGTELSTAAMTAVENVFDTADFVADHQEFNTGGTWTKPTGAKIVKVIAVGSGGGGGAGDHVNASGGSGGGGGGGGAVVLGTFDASDLGATETITVGVGGTGQAGVARDSGAATAATDGSVSSFGTWLKAGGGGYGASGSGATGGAGGGSGSVLNSGAAGVGGAPTAGAADGLSGQGATGGSSTAGFSCEYGGGSGGRGGSSGIGLNGGSSIYSAGGGAGGSGSGGTSGGVGGIPQSYSSGGGAAGTGVAGSTNATLNKGYGGGGGGGGNSTGSSVSSVGVDGGTGGAPGGGGGGGGGGRHDTVNQTSGSGGDGGAGMVRVITFF